MIVVHYLKSRNNIVKTKSVFTSIIYCKKREKGRITRPTVRTQPFCTSAGQTVQWFRGHSAFVHHILSIEVSAVVDHWERRQQYLHSPNDARWQFFTRDNFFPLCIQMMSNTVLSGQYVKLSNWRFSATIDSSVLTMHKTLVTDWLTYVHNIMQPSFVGPFDVVGPT